MLDPNRERRREYERNYRKANPDKVRAAQKRYRDANRVKINAAARRRHAANPAIARQASARWRAKNPQYRSHKPEVYSPWRLQHYHGLSTGAWLQLVEDQGGCCYLCGDPFPPPDLRDHKSIHIDHDHDCHPSGWSCSGCRRGLACYRCNLAIGLARDDPERLELIASNLRAAQAQTRPRLIEPLF